jgi:hypothetical protein
MAEQAFPRAGTSLHNGRLLLTPDNPGAQVPRERLARRLQEAGLLGTAQADTPGTYSTGPHLFELVAFTGCAVQLDDGGAGAGIQVRLEGPFSTPTRRSGRNARPPRCPQCRRPLLRWAQQLDAAGADGVHGNSTEERLRCEACDTEAPAWSWDWGRHAGYGSLFVALEPVFPGEGRPLPKLFRALDTLEVGPWRHFYVQD